MASGSYDYYPGESRGPPAPPPPPGEAVNWSEPPKPQPAPQSAPPQSRPYGDLIGSKPAAILAILGILIFFIGMVLLQSVALLEAPEYEDFEDEDDPNEELDKAREKYQDQQRNLYGSGRILNWMGLMVLCIPFLAMGIGNKSLDWKLRASIITATTALVIVTIIMTPFSYFSP